MKRFYTQKNTRKAHKQIYANLHFMPLMPFQKIISFFMKIYT